MAMRRGYPAGSGRRNVRWATALAMVISIVGTVSLKADSARPPQAALIVFLGIGSAARDVSYQRFMAAADRLPAETRRRMQIRFMDSGLETPASTPAAVRRVAALHPVLIVAPSSATAKLAKDHAGATPIVFGSVLDPVRYGVVSAMERRAEAMTGIWVADTLDAKRLEILRDAYPLVKRVAVLIDRPWGEYFDTEKTLPPIAARLGLEVTILYAENTVEAQALFAEPRAAGFDAWCIPRSGLAGLNTPMIVDRLRAWGKPVILANTTDMAVGAPLSYALDMSFAWPAMAELVVRVLDGEAPGSIPILRPQRAVLAVRPNPEGGFPAPSAQVVRRADVVLR